MITKSAYSIHNFFNSGAQALLRRLNTKFLGLEPYQFQGFSQSEVSFIAKFINGTEVDQPVTFFDLGCNLGEFSLLLHEAIDRPFVSWKAVDADESSVELLQLRARELGMEIEVLSATLGIATPARLGKVDEYLGRCMGANCWGDDSISMQPHDLFGLVESSNLLVVKSDIEGWDIPFIINSIDLFESRQIGFWLFEFALNSAYSGSFQLVEKKLLELGYGLYLIRKNGNLVKVTNINSVLGRLCPFNIAAIREDLLDDSLVILTLGIDRRGFLEIKRRG